MRIINRKSAGALVALAAFTAPALISDRAAYASSPEPTVTTFSYTGALRADSMVNLKALVDPTDGGGTVRFTMDGLTIPGCATRGFGSGGGLLWQAICSTYLGGGKHTIVVTYSGDPSFQASASAATELTIVNVALP